MGNSWKTRDPLKTHGCQQDLFQGPGTWRRAEVPHETWARRGCVRARTPFPCGTGQSFRRGTQQVNEWPGAHTRSEPPQPCARSCCCCAVTRLQLCDCSQRHGLLSSPSSAINYTATWLPVSVCSSQPLKRVSSAITCPGYFALLQCCLQLCMAKEHGWSRGADNDIAPKSWKAPFI